MIIPEQKCSIKNCQRRGRIDCRNNKEYFTRGYCSYHYQNYIKRGSPIIVPRIRKPLKFTSEYLRRCYFNMLQRCNNIKNPRFKAYGGRGIKVAIKWQGSNGYEEFENYILSALGERPSKDYSLDRIDNNRGYEEGNLRWATSSMQYSNRRNRLPSRYYAE